jgi:hypothetical protein
MLENPDHGTATNSPGTRGAFAASMSPSPNDT